LLISTLEIKLSRLSIWFESNCQDSIRFLELNSISQIDVVSLTSTTIVTRENIFRENILDFLKTTRKLIQLTTLKRASKQIS